MASLKQPPQQQAVAHVFLMLLSVTFLSLVPLAFDVVVGTNNPILFGSGLSAGRAIGSALFLLAFCYPLVVDSTFIALVRSQIRRGITVVVVLSLFEHVLFAWATTFVDTAVAAIIRESWPILFMLIMARLYRDAEGNRPRYVRVTLETLIPFVFAFAGVAFVIRSTANQPVVGGQEGDYMWVWGIALAIMAALLSSLGAFIFRWGSDLQRAIPSTSRYDKTPIQLELFCVMLAFGLGSGFVAIISAPFGILVGDGITFGGLGVAVGIGCLLIVPGNIFFRFANLRTDDLGVNALVYLNPVLALIWLALFSDINVARLDYLLIGAAAIVAMNLVLNLDPERRLGFNRRLGFKSFLLSVWLFGWLIYLRDDLFESFIGVDFVWNGEYWGIIAMSGTVFTLILSFRITRLSNRIVAEENATIVLFRKLELLVKGKQIGHEILEVTRRIKTLSKPEDLHRAYTKAMEVFESETGNISEDIKSEIAVAQGDFEKLLQSRQQGREFGEMVAVLAFAVLTISLTLASRPQVEGWAGLLSELFAIFFAAVIAFLTVNMFDLRRERSTAIIIRTSTAARGRSVYRIALRADRHPFVEQTVSVVIGFGLILVYGYLLYGKWI